MTTEHAGVDYERLFKAEQQAMRNMLEDRGIPVLPGDLPLVVLLDRLDKCLEALASALPSGVATDNRNIPDEQIIPLDFTMGELRRMAAAIATATPA